MRRVRGRDKHKNAIERELRGPQGHIFGIEQFKRASRITEAIIVIVERVRRQRRAQHTICGWHGRGWNGLRMVEKRQNAGHGDGQDSMLAGTRLANCTAWVGDVAVFDGARVGAEVCKALWTQGQGHDHESQDANRGHQFFLTECIIGCSWNLSVVGILVATLSFQSA